MPEVICSYCNYKGRGCGFHAQLMDVRTHEFNCKNNPMNGGNGKDPFDISLSDLME